VKYFLNEDKRPASELTAEELYLVFRSDRREWLKSEDNWVEDKHAIGFYGVYRVPAPPFGKQDLLKEIEKLVSYEVIGAITATAILRDEVIALINKLDTGEDK
jgi:hypothetical protein